MLSMVCCCPAGANSMQPSRSGRHVKQYDPPTNRNFNAQAPLCCSSHAACSSTCTAGRSRTVPASHCTGLITSLHNPVGCHWEHSSDFVSVMRYPSDAIPIPSGLAIVVPLWQRIKRSGDVQTNAVWSKCKIIAPASKLLLAVPDTLRGQGSSSSIF